MNKICVNLKAGSHYAIFLRGKITLKPRDKIVSKSRDFFAPKQFTLRDFIAQFFSTWLTFFHALWTSFLSQSTTSSSTSAINLSISNIDNGWEAGLNYWMEENEFQNFEFSNFAKMKDTISGVWSPQKSLRHVSWHQMPLDAYTHTLHTHTISKNCADSDFCCNMLGQDVERFFITRFKFLSRGNRTKNCIIWTVRFNIICRDKWGDFTAWKNRIVWTSIYKELVEILYLLLQKF